MPELLTVVVTYNNEDVVGPCLHAAAAAGLTDVLVWDNGSADGTVALVEGLGLPGVRVVRGGENLGFGAAVNRAAALDPPRDHLLLLNPDCRVAPVTVASMRAHLDRDPTLAAVVPRMEYPDGSRGFAGGPWPSLLKELVAASRVDDLLPRAWLRALLAGLTRLGVLGGLTGYAGARDADGPVVCDWVSGFCLLVRADAWRSVHGFDERFFLYFEDVDLCRRLRAQGYRVLIDNDVAAVHLESTSSTTSVKNAHYRRALRTYLRLHGGRVERRLAALAERMAR